MTPAIYLALLAAMSLTGWLVTASKRRVFWLAVRRSGRRAFAIYCGSAVDAAFRRFDRHMESYLAMDSLVRSFEWRHRAITRMCRYYAGVPVFQNRVFRLQ